MDSNKSLIVFLIKATVIYLIWVATYEDYISPLIDVPLSKNLGEVTIFFLNSIGIDSFTSTPSLGSLSNNPTAVSAIWVNDKPTVSIANECNGVELMALFIGFILAYNGDWKLKTLYMIIGLISIYAINLIRIQLLIANSIYSQETLDFNHHYTFTIAVYACVFGMWMLWANKLSKIKFNPQKGKEGFVTTK